MRNKLLGATLVVLTSIGIALAITPARGAGLSLAADSLPQAVPAIGGASAPPGYRLVWDDEFDAAAVDTTKWNVFDNSNFGSSNKEDECYFAANATVSNGQLHLTAKRETVTCSGTNPDTRTKTYYVTSGALATTLQGTQPEKFKFSQGYVEAAVRLPKGNPFWGAFWLVGSSTSPGWPTYGEFDVLEQPGGYGDLITQAMHYTCGTSGHCSTSGSSYYNLATGSGSNAAANMGTNLSSTNYDAYDGSTTSGYVRYGLLWEKGRVTWYVNGRPTRSFNGTNLTAYTTDTDGTITASAVPLSVGKGLSGVSPDMDTVTSYEHTLMLNLAYGGAYPKSYGYTGGETSTGYNDGNRLGPEPGVMDVDYVRVYQVSDPPNDPSATTDPSPSNDPSATTDPSPTNYPSPTTDPTASNDPSATTDPTPTNDPSATTDPTPSNDPSPSTNPQPSQDPGPPPDTTNPAVVFVAPTNGSSVQGNVALTASAADDVGVTRVDFAVDGVPYLSDSDSSNGWGAVWPTSGVSAGLHNLTLTAYDAAGNHASVTNLVTVTKPVPTPTISSFTATPSSLLAGLTSTLKWTSANAVSCAVTPGGPTASTATSWTTPLQLKAGKFTYTLTCKNSAGATVSRTTTLTVTNATKPPTNVTLTLSAKTVTANSKVTFKWTSTGSTRCQVTPGGTSVNGTTGSTTLTVARTTTYRVACSNAAGTTYSTGQTVTVR